MKSFKKIKVFFFLVILLGAVVTFTPMVFVHGGTTGTTGGTTGTTDGEYELPNPLDAESFEDLVNSIAEWFYTISIPLASIVILYAGALFMTSGGDEEKIKKAKRALTWAIVGITIIIIGAGFITLIKDILGTDESSSSQEGSSLPGSGSECVGEGQGCTTSGGGTGTCSWEGALGKFTCSGGPGGSSCVSEGGSCITSGGKLGTCAWEAATKKFVCEQLCSSCVSAGQSCTTPGGKLGTCVWDSAAKKFVCE